jgi:hypothetical protein
MPTPLPGDRIRLLATPDDRDPVPPGTTGAVKAVHPRGTGPDQWLQVEVDWDNRRRLMLMVPPDEFEILASPA